MEDDYIIKEQHGFFSQSAIDDGYGYAIYLDDKNEEVCVTCISDTPVLNKTQYGRIDTIYVGRIYKFIKTIRSKHYYFGQFNNSLSVYKFVINYIGSIKEKDKMVIIPFNPKIEEVD